MCLLCVEFQKGKMSVLEVRSALRELTSEQNVTDPDFWHYVDLSETTNIEEELNEYEG